LSFDELLKRAGGFEQLFKEAREGGVNLEREVQRALRKDSLLFRTVGYTVLKMGDGMVEVSFPFSRAITRRGGIVHGGVTMYTLDTVCGLAVMTVNPGPDQLTLALSVDFLAPLRKGPFVARGTIIRAGGSTAVAEGEIRDANRQLCAKSLGTFYLTGKKTKR
jgi:acyl-CoA thioesterase